jgi:hypothetical protein
VRENTHAITQKIIQFYRLQFLQWSTETNKKVPNKNKSSLDILLPNCVIIFKEIFFRLVQDSNEWQKKWEASINKKLKIHDSNDDST